MLQVLGQAPQGLGSNPAFSQLAPQGLGGSPAGRQVAGGLEGGKRITEAIGNVGVEVVGTIGRRLTMVAKQLKMDKTIRQVDMEAKRRALLSSAC